MKEVKSTGAWVPRQMFCPNCGTLNTAYEQDNLTKFECHHCTTVFVRSYKNRRQDLLLITIPKGTVRLT